MHWAFRILGVVLDLLGLVWVLQGIGVLQGSQTTGQGFWVDAVLVLFVVVVSPVYLGIRLRQV